MPLSSHDARLEESLGKLRSIVARRNELLHEMFRMMQSRENITSILLDPGQENPHLPAFLQRFDLSSNFDQGSITNLRQEDLWFLNKDEQVQSVSLPSDVEMEGHVVDSVTSSLLAPVRHPATTSEEASTGQGPSQEATKSISPSLYDTQTLDARERPLETSDKDNDELDLIGQLTVSELEASPSTQTTFRPATEDEEKEMVNAREDSIPKDLVGLVPDKEQHYPKVITPLDSATAMDAHLRKQTSVAEVSLAVASGSSRTLDFINFGNEAAFSFAGKGNESPPSSTKSIGARHICVSLPPSVQEALLIPTPTTALKEENFSIDIDLTADFEKSHSSPAKIDTRHHFDPQYIVPSLDLLPPEFTRKVKPAKLRRRDKNGEKELKRDGEKDSKRDRDENVPLGLNRWNAILTANPIWKKVSRASKCLSTRDWGVAMTELRLIRTIQRIDQLKEEGRWSFRQPKKQRGVGGMTKSHWDYVLDEMRWMRIDFREERRWKIALAYNLSTAVLEWHLAKTREERQRSGICVKWQCPNDEVDQGTPTETVNMDIEQPRSQSHHLGLSYCSDEEDGTLDESRIVVDALQPSAVIEDALMTPASDFHPKNEDVDDQVAIDLLRQGADENSNSFEHSPAYPSGAAIGNALKTTSNDPLLGDTKSSSQSTNGDGETADPPVSDLKSGRTALAPIRGQIAYSEAHQLFVPTSDLLPDPSMDQALDTNDSLDLRDIFPELHPLGLLDVSATNIPADGKRKVEKRSDRDDPNRRIEDTTYTKLYPTGRFMYSKPTLIGPLQPAKRWKGGKWAPIEQTPITSDTEFNQRIFEDNISELFDGRASTSNLAQQLQASSFKDKEGKRDSSGHSWSATDDTLLKSLVDKYSMNWPLLAECFNSSRLSTLTDRRSAADCLQRWKEKWGAERKAPPTEPSQNSGEALSANPQMTTRGVKRLASTSVASPTTASGTGNTEIKKRRRHLLLQDSMRKAGRKRVETAQKLLSNQRKPPQVHETHNQFNKLPRLSPAELGRMKAERDLQTSQDIVLARKRQDEHIRQSLLLREQVQRGNAQPSQGQQPQSSQQSQTPLPAQQQQQQQQQQQSAQLQQLQQQANQNPRPNIPTAGLPNRSARLSAATNLRQAGQQPQIQQQRPVQVQSGASSNTALPPVNNVAHAAGTNFYGLPTNVTQEQVEQFRTPLLTAQQQQQQGQSSLNNFGGQPT